MTPDKSSQQTDRIVLDITIRENTREEGAEALEQYLHDMLNSVYEDREFDVTEADE